MLPVKKGGWLRVLFVRLYKLSLLAASYPAVLQLVTKNKILHREDRDPVMYHIAGGERLRGRGIGGNTAVRRRVGMGECG